MKARLVILLQYGCLSVGTLLVSVVAFARIEGYQASRAAVPEAPVAILRVPELGLEVPVYATFVDQGGGPHGRHRARRLARPAGHAGDLLPVLHSRQRTAAIHRAGRL